MSKLGEFCSRIIEAGWLGVVVATPLYFSGYTGTVMDPDKLALLESITALMLAAWLVKWIDTRRAAHPVQSARPRLIALLPVLVLGATLLATLTSIAPRVSLLGSYYRAQGAYAIVCFAVVFAMLWKELRTSRQLDRLIAAIILTSFPIALYGILQKVGLDPIVWSSSFDGRAGSTTGNPIFLAAFLLMVFVLTLGKVVISVRAIVARKSPRGVAAEKILAAAYTLVAVTQAAAIVATDSRGPFLGWFAGIVLFVLLIGLVWRKTGFVLGGIGFGLLGALLLIGLNLPNSPLTPLRALPGLSRLGNLANPTGEFRLYTWENAARLALPHAPLQFPDGTPDALNGIRPLVGYGPEAMPLVYTQVAPASPFSSDIGTDRSHNVTWDAWVSTGLLGLVAYQLFFLGLFLYGFQHLGLIQSPRQRNGFAAMWIGLGGLGAALALVSGQPLWLGIALPAGNILALLLYLAWFALSANGRLPQQNAGRADQILVVALLAGLFGHYVESQFGIDVPPTQTMLWVFAGILAVLGTTQLDALPQGDRVKTASSPPRIPAWLGNAAAYGLVIALVLSTLLYEFITYEKGVSNPLQLIWSGLTFNSAANSTQYAVLGLLLAAWIVGIFVSWSELSRSEEFGPSGSGSALASVLAASSSILAVLFALGLAVQLGALQYLPTPVAHMQDLLTLAGQEIGIVNYYPLALFAFILLMVVVLASQSSPRPHAWASSRWVWIAVAPVALATLVWINAIDLSPARADSTYRLGQLFDKQEDWNSAIALYKRAIQLAPTNDAYYMTLARATKQKSLQAPAAAPAVWTAALSPSEIVNQPDAAAAGLSRLDLLFATQALLLRARELNPLYADHSLNLARFYQPELPVDTPSKSQLADMAERYYAQAQRISPNSVSLWNEWANFDLTCRNDPDAALQKLRESLARDPQSAETYSYMGTAFAEKHDYDQAVQNYRQALALDPGQADAQSKLAFVYYQQGQVGDSIAAYQKYIAMAPTSPNLWEAHKNLSVLYLQSGDRAEAIQEGKLAIHLAPATYAAQLGDWVKQLQGP